jgi:excisionase family DNA binding protein
VSGHGDLTTREAALYLGVGRTTLYRLGRKHKIRRVEFGAKRLWWLEDLDRVRRLNTRTMR